MTPLLSNKTSPANATLIKLLNQDAAESLTDNKVNPFIRVGFVLFPTNPTEAKKALEKHEKNELVEYKKNHSTGANTRPATCYLLSKDVDGQESTARTVTANLPKDVIIAALTSYLNIEVFMGNEEIYPDLYSKSPSR